LSTYVQYGKSPENVLQTLILAMWNTMTRSAIDKSRQYDDVPGSMLDGMLENMAEGMLNGVYKVRRLNMIKNSIFLTSIGSDIRKSPQTCTSFSSQLCCPQPWLLP